MGHRTESTRRPRPGPCPKKPAGLGAARFSGLGPGWGQMAMTYGPWACPVSNGMSYVRPCPVSYGPVLSPTPCPIVRWLQWACPVSHCPLPCPLSHVPWPNGACLLGRVQGVPPNGRAQWSRPRTSYPSPESDSGSLRCGTPGCPSLFRLGQGISPPRGGEV